MMYEHEHVTQLAHMFFQVSFYFVKWSYLPL